MCLRFNTVTRVAAEYFDERFGADSWQLAQLLHFSVALRALADIVDLSDHRAMMDIKSAGTMKIGSVILRQKRRFGLNARSRVRP